MTEVYNLVRIDIPNDHKSIPGTDSAAVSNPWTGGLFSQQPSIKREISPYSEHRVSEVRI